MPLLRPAVQLVGALLVGRAPLVFKLAARNLFHDRLRLAATITGVVFSMVLVTVQMGLFVSFHTMVTTMIDHAPADLWIMPLATIVGIVIVAQTLYASTKEFSNEFATLRAIGSSSRYVYTVIIIQALLSAAIGFGIAAAIGMVIVKATANSALPVLIPDGLMVGLFLVAVAMCVVSAIAAIVHIMRTDPAVVFTR